MRDSVAPVGGLGGVCLYSPEFDKHNKKIDFGQACLCMYIYMPPTQAVRVMKTWYVNFEKLTNPFACFERWSMTTGFPWILSILNVLSFCLSQISCIATSPTLSDAKRYRRFIQLLPPEFESAQGFYSIISHYGWKRVGVILQEADLFEKVCTS